MQVKRFAVILLSALTILAAVSGTTGCGDKSGISSEDHDKVQVGMTMDEVESILGQPKRSHVTGSSQDPEIFWYYTKSEGSGLTKISFEQGKVTSISPYDQSFNVGE